MYAGWRRYLPAGLDLYAARLPGREEKLRQPPRRELLPLAEEIAAAVVEDGGHQVVALAGFSLGGLLAFEVASNLEREGVEIALLTVGATRAPNAQWPRGALHTLEDEEFLRQLDQRYGGVAWEVLKRDEMRRMVLPMLRSDIHMVETYAYQHAGLQLNTDLLVLYGESDAMVTADHVEPWRELAPKAELVSLPGDHFFARTQAEAILGAIATRLGFGDGRAV